MGKPWGTLGPYRYALTHGGHFRTMRDGARFDIRNVLEERGPLSRAELKAALPQHAPTHIHRMMSQMAKAGQIRRLPRGGEADDGPDDEQPARSESNARL